MRHSPPNSPYYPPRAKWHSGIWLVLERTGRLFALDRIKTPGDVSWPAFLTSLVVPGLAVYVRGPVAWGHVAMALSALCLAVFMVFFGFPVANLALGVLMATHTIGLLYLCKIWLLEARPLYRIFFALAALAAITLGFYMPARSYVLHHWLMPLRVNGKVIIIRVATPRTLRPGDYLAYELPHAHQSGVYVREGYGLGPVLAGPGDQIKFTPTGFLVNGQKFPLRERMPTEAELVVPQKHWFIWPDLSINVHGNVSADAIQSTLLQLAMVSEQRAVGKPFQRWLWRKQLPL